MDPTKTTDTTDTTAGRATGAAAAPARATDHAAGEQKAGMTGQGYGETYLGDSSDEGAANWNRLIDTAGVITSDKLAELRGTAVPTPTELVGLAALGFQFAQRINGRLGVHPVVIEYNGIEAVATGIDLADGKLYLRREDLATAADNSPGPQPAPVKLTDAHLETICVGLGFWAPFEPLRAPDAKAGA